MPSLKLISKDPASLVADALVLGVHQGADGPQVVAPELSSRVAKRVQELLGPLGVTGKADEVVRFPLDGVKAPVTVLTGLGRRTDPESLRRAAGAAVRSLSKVDDVVVALPAQSVPDLAAVTEGALFGNYAYTAYKSEAGTRPDGFTVVTPLARDKAAGRAVDRAQILALAVAGAKDLVNCPPNDLYPQTFAELAVKAAKAAGVGAEVLDEGALAAGGYGGLTNVGKGSVRGPRLVKLTWKGGRKPRGHVSLVGKGITFDSGGLSLKPGDSMKTMKLDMAGAAAVLHTVIAAAQLEIPVQVTAFLCLAENMPSGDAQRPSDVITILGGKTVEVLNTDAEGRLVLADALVAASRLQPDFIVDVATLTGAQMVALGNRVSAVMANDDALRQAVVDAATTSGEQFWPMPLPEELRASLDSPVADLANIGDRMGGMLSAGIFLREFIEDGADGNPVPWAHLDIAGPAFNDAGPHGYTGKGGTGVALRTMLQLLDDHAAARG